MLANSGLVQGLPSLHAECYICESCIDMTQNAGVTKASSSRDPLIIEEGPMMRPRAKRVKETMGMLVKTTIDDAMLGTQNGVSFILGPKSEETWINIIKVDEKKVVGQSHATVELSGACSHRPMQGVIGGKFLIPCDRMVQIFDAFF